MPHVCYHPAPISNTCANPVGNHKSSDGEEAKQNSQKKKINRKNLPSVPHALNMDYYRMWRRGEIFSNSSISPQITMPHRWRPHLVSKQRVTVHQNVQWQHNERQPKHFP